MKEILGWTLFVVIVLAVMGGLILSVKSCYDVYGEEVLIKDTIEKTIGGERLTKKYYIYTDKGYFEVSGPVDADGTPHAWRLADKSKGQKVKIKSYGWRVDGWMWYPNIFEVHK